MVLAFQHEVVHSKQCKANARGNVRRHYMERLPKAINQKKGNVLANNNFRKKLHIFRTLKISNCRDLISLSIEQQYPPSASPTVLSFSNASIIRIFFILR
jgi:hypothetical protein